MDNPIRIDGSRGEGGGQILRTALALSVWLGRPFEISRIRAQRKRPGLAAQHLTAVRAAAEICAAAVSRAELGSTELKFVPGELRPGNYRWAVGTAGAATLVTQAAALPLLTTSGDSRLRIAGGSHVAWAPPLDYLRDVYAPLLALLGLDLRPRLVRYGFYPRGGGEIQVDLGGRAANARDSARPALALHRPPAGEICVEVAAVVSSLPRAIAERMLATAAALLGSGPWRYASRIVEAHGPQGTYLFVRVHGAGASQTKDASVTPASGGSAVGAGERSVAEQRGLIAGGFTGLGVRGKPAEEVASEAARETLDFLQSDACVDAHLADQILLPVILAGATLRFRAHRLTAHFRTNAETIALFLGPCVFSDRAGVVEVRPPTLETEPRM